MRRAQPFLSVVAILRCQETHEDAATFVINLLACVTGPDIHTARWTVKAEMQELAR